MSARSSSASRKSTRSRDSSPLGAWIRTTRMDQRISQRELADLSGLSRSYVCDIERGRGAHPSVDTLDKLAAALGASRADLLQASGLIDPAGGPRQTDAERRLLSVYRDLGESGQALVMRFARFVHQDEHAWVQSRFNGESGDELESRPERAGNYRGPTLFDLSDEQ